MKFAKAKESKKEFYGVTKPIKKQNFDVGNIAVWKLIETKNNSNYFIGYLNVTRPSVLILPKRSENFRTFKQKDGDKDRLKKKKLMPF